MEGYLFRFAPQKEKASQPSLSRYRYFIKKAEKALLQSAFSKNPVISFWVLRAIKETSFVYLNGMLTNEQVIEELLNLAKQIQAAQKEGEQLGLTADELAFYDALTKPQAIKDFYENEELIAITKELAETLRKNKTIDWQKRDSARAKMRMLIKKLLKKHRYPPEGMDDAVQTVMTQCELWTDNNDMSA